MLKETFTGPKGLDIEQVTDFNFLSLIIDNNFNWKKHTEKMSNACSKNNGS